MDHPRQPGAEPEPRAGIRAGGHPTRPAGAGLGPGRKGAGTLRTRRHCAGHHTGRKPRRAQLQTPAARRSRCRHRPVQLPAPGPRLPSRLRHRRRRHGYRALIASLRRGRLQLLRQQRHLTRRHPEPGAGHRCVCGRAAHVWRPVHLEGRTCHRGRPARCGSLAGDGNHHPQLPTLLAPQDAGDLPRRSPVVHPYGRGRRCVHG